MSTRKAAFIYSQQLEEHSYPPEHPFNTIRATRVRQILNSMGLLSGNGRSEVPPDPAERTVLEKFHSARYLDALEAASQRHWNAGALGMGIGTSDCPVFEGLYDYAVLAVGGTLTAVKLILSGSAYVAFNPSGGFHHAGPERASGFCYINDVALACLTLAEAEKKVLYLDVDVHHGDGVAYGFYDRDDVMTVSFHQDPRTLFPGTGFAEKMGSGRGKGYCVNVPLPIGTHDQAYMTAFNAITPPLIEAFDPDVFVFELGADALAGDPLAQLHLTNNVYADVIDCLLGYNKPILMTGGGGYNVENTVRAWALAWTVLCGADSHGQASIGAGGVMLESTDWQGGLRDRELGVSAQQQGAVMPAIEAVVKVIRANVFPLHGL